jgi:hypothetical protein
VLLRIRRFGFFDGATLGIRFDELVFGIVVPSVAVFLQYPRNRMISGGSNLCNVCPALARRVKDGIVIIEVRED